MEMVRFYCMAKQWLIYLHRNPIKESFQQGNGGYLMENIKVSYNENWDCEGYHTTQNIKLSENMLQRFNIFLADCRKLADKKHLRTSEEMNILIYGKNVENLNRCLHLTQLRLLYQFLMQNHIDCSRVKTDRNTMLIVS